MSQQEWVPAWVTATAVGACALLAATACAGAPPPLAHAPIAAPAPAPIPAPASSAAAAKPMPVIDACPRELNVRQAVTADVPGWTSTNPQESYPFARIAFYSGPPADDKRVVPTFENRTSTGLHDGWLLPKQPAGYWVQCQYGNTAAAVIRKLDDINNFCVADYDPRFTTLVVKHWACMPGKTPPPPAPRPATPTAKLPQKWTHGP